MAELPKLIKELMLLRRQKGWSQGEVAAAVMVSVEALRTWESGEHFPNPDNRERVRDFIDLHTKDYGFAEKAK